MRSARDNVPISVPNLWSEIAHIASHMAQLVRVNPLPSATGTWCGRPRSLVVSGTTIACRIGIELNRSDDTTTQGLVPRCSSATTGSRVTSQS